MIIDLGIVKPGSTIRIPWSSFAGADGSQITVTNYAAADLLIYKDGGATERASTAGLTATTDFDSKTGKQLAVIDLADNTAAGFYSSGSEYNVAIDAVTIDGASTGGWIGRFKIGYPSAALDTTIATLASQTSFALTNGPAEDDALNGFTMMAHDVASAIQSGMAYVSDYTGSTKTVTLVAGPTFTMAATDNVSFFTPIQVFGFGGTAATSSGGRPEVNTTHWLGTACATPTVAGVPEVDLTHVGGATTNVSALATNVNEILTDTGTTLDARIPAALVGGRMDANVGAISGDATAADNAEAFFDGTGYAGTNNVMPLVTTTTTLTNDPTGVGTLLSRVGTPSDLGGGASISANLADIESQTDDIGVAGAGLTNINLPNQTMDIVGNITGNLSGSVGSVTGHTPQTGDVYALANGASGFVATKADTAAILLDTGTDGVMVADKTGYRLSSTGVADVWAYVVEGTWTAVMYMRLIASSLFGKISGAGTNTVVIRDVDDTKNRISATVDVDGNRSAFGTRDGT